MIGLEALLVAAGIVLLIIGAHVLGWILLGVGLLIVAVELIAAMVLGKTVFNVWRFVRRSKRTVT